MIKESFKKGKAIMILSVAGILLIGFSSFVPKKQTDSVKNVSINEVDAEQYRLSLQEQIKKTVVSITGDSKASVVITLETSVRYSYASETEENKNNRKENDKSDSTLGVKTSYITVKTDSGAEQALLVTQYMPEIRGVAVVCNGGNDKQINQSVTDAVTAALGVTSKRVFVTAPAN